MKPSKPAHSVTVSHTFEAGHRLPHLPGKCQSLHGHSWKVEVSVDLEGDLGDDGLIVNFSLLKAALRSWVDDHLDHGLMLGVHDPLAPLLEAHGKIFVFGRSANPSTREGIYDDSPAARPLNWPTVENVAEMIGRVMTSLLESLEPARGAYVSYVTISETNTNDATWIAPIPEGALGIGESL